MKNVAAPAKRQDKNEQKRLTNLVMTQPVKFGIGK